MEQRSSIGLKKGTISCSGYAASHNSSHYNTQQAFPEIGFLHVRPAMTRFPLGFVPVPRPCDHVPAELQFNDMSCCYVDLDGQRIS
jgi:hypothetical protein